MRKIILLVLLSSLCLCSSGCVVGMAALIRWDHMRWKKQQQEERDRVAQQEECKTDILEVPGSTPGVVTTDDE